MSEQIQPHKPGGTKVKGLGRGLGSLLSPTEDAGAFAQTLEIQAPTQTAMPTPSYVQAPVLETTLAVVNPARPSPSDTTPAHLRIWQIPIEKVEPNPRQPRQIFEEAPLKELADSIREKGIIQPILVTQKGPDLFEIVAGERRWRAAQLAGLKEVPAILKKAEPQEALELALIENIQRQNLNVIEEAEAYDFLIKKYNSTQNDLAQKVGKDRATIANVVRLLNLEPEVRQMVSRNEISLGQAKVLLSITEPKAQLKLAIRTRDESLSVRALERVATRIKNKGNDVISELDESQRLRNQLARSLGEQLQRQIGSRVTLDYDQGKGRITIYFHSDQELNEIAEKLGNAWQS